MSKLKLFFRLTKVDEAQRIVYGRAVDETVDHVKEAFDYATSKPYFEKWSAAFVKATDGKSMGNLRAMHGKVAAGKLEQVGFNDDDKAIDVAAKVVDDQEWTKVQEGVYTGFSIGGRYVKKWKDGDATRYTCEPSEISLVDNPCVPTAMFESVKADGAVMQKYFQAGHDQVEAAARELAKAAGKPEDGWAEFEVTAREQLAKDAAGPAAVEEIADEAPAAGAVEPTNEAIVAKAAELAKAKGGTWTSYTDEARAALLAASTAGGAPVEKLAPGATAPAAGAAAGGDGDWEQVWVSKRLPGKEFKTKALLRQALTDLDATEKAAAKSAPVTAALQKIRDQIGKVTTTTVGDLVAKMAAAAAGDLIKINETAIMLAAGVDAAGWAAASAFAVANPAHDLVKALGAVAIKYGPDSKVIEVPADAVTALKALAAQATKPPTYNAEQLAAMVKSGEALKDGSLAIADKADLEAAAKSFVGAKRVPETARRHLIKRAKALKALDALPEGLFEPNEAPVAKGVSLYSVANLVQLLASIEDAEECFERPEHYYGVGMPADLCTRFGDIVVELGDIVAEALDVVLQAMKDEEAGEAMSRAAGATDLLKGVLLTAEALTKFAAPEALAKIAPAGAPGAIGELEQRLIAQESEFEKSLGTILSVVEDLAGRLKTVEDTPLPVGTTSVTAAGKTRVAEKSEDSTMTPAGTLTPEQLLSSPDVLSKLADIAIRSAHGRPVHTVPGHSAPSA